MVVVSRCVPLCPALWLPSVVAFGSVVVASRCFPLFLLKFFRRCARLLFSLYPLKASSQITGAEGAERSEAPEAPRYPLKASFQIPGAEGAERSEAPEAPLYP